MPANVKTRLPSSAAAAKEQGKTNYKVPKSVAECADQLYLLDEKRALLNRQVSEIEGQMSAIREYVIKELPKSNATGITGKVARVTVESKDIPQAKDWDLLFAFVARTKQFDLLQRRLSPAAVEERWKVKKQVPGVEVFTATVVRVSKK